MASSFKSKFGCESRKLVASNIRSNYPDLFPVVVENGFSSRRPFYKQIAPESATVNDLLHSEVFQSYQEDVASLGAVAYISDDCVPLDSTIGSLFERYKDAEDGFLYVTLRPEREPLKKVKAEKQSESKLKDTQSMPAVQPVAEMPTEMDVIPVSVAPVETAASPAAVAVPAVTDSAEPIPSASSIASHATAVVDGPAPEAPTDAATTALEEPTPEPAAAVIPAEEASEPSPMDTSPTVEAVPPLPAVPAPAVPPAVPASPAASAAMPDSPVGSPATTAVSPASLRRFTIDELNAMKVADLKKHLKDLGLPQNGLKAELVTRLAARLGA
eukprot:TRINITY_DN6576_c0_g1_i1.p1 TRINITY_DN6576_c0_g1~~TRINITY_DN6576_c0_g1_i1.p1  ORF type:complete len:382 (-),score=47.47 TRINITY_DN6576_c0_g1_i1:128-1114(-)